MNRLVTLILLMVWSACAQTATAAQERVLHFHAEITVHPDASLTVEETIAVQATGETIRRGIVREFPTRYTDSHGRTMEVGFELIRVLRDGHPEPYHVERRQNGVAIFIGAKDVFLAPGQYVYTIAYRTTRQLGFFAEHDELYWNVNGNGWRLPMDQVTGAVQLPPGATSFAGRAYEGPQGSTAGFDLPSGESRIFFASTRPYAPGEGLTIVVTWPKGWVTPSDDAPTSLDDLGRFLVAPQALSSPTATAAGLGLVLALGYYVFAWIRVGRDPAPGVIIPRFDPPKGFSPAMVRMLFHLGFDTTAMTAAIVNLAVRGLLCIKDTGSSSRSIKLTPPAVPPALPPGEAALWEALSARGRRHVRLDGSDHRVMRAARTALQHALEKELAGAYFRTNSAWTLPGLAITGMCMIVIGISTPQLPVFFFLCVWLTFWSFGCIAMLRQVWQGWKSPFLRQKAAATVLAVFSIPFLGGEVLGLWFLQNVVGLPTTAALAGQMGAAVLFYHLLKAPTVAGRRILDAIEGFRMYLRLAEKERLELLHPPEETPALFERFLPYAIALEVENAWGARFARILQEAGYTPSWYVGAHFHPHTPSSFAQGLSHELNSSIAAAARAPGSSSGMSGGSSGGGGGGGGGGGW